MNIEYELMRQFLLIIGLGLVLLALIVGLGLVLIPRWIFIFNDYSRIWFSTRKTGLIFGKPIDMEEFFFQHNKLIGSVLCAIGVTSLYLLWANYSATEFVNFFGEKNHVVVEWVTQGVYIFFMFNSIWAILLGVLLIFNPVFIKKLNLFFNHWYSMRRVIKELELMRNNADHFVESHAQISGIVITISS
ncbi:MAG: hypothetical protein ACD_69C00116G0001, partial [uncultured bacterium]